jgi:preprotein translocase subunit YajC
MNLLSILLQLTSTPTTGGGASQYSGILMMVLIFVVFYFFMIRPQSKRQKEIKKQREAMQAGDKVVTSGGIYGKVKEIKETTVVIEIAENVRIKVDKNSVFASADDAQTDTK